MDLLYNNESILIKYYKITVKIKKKHTQSEQSQMKNIQQNSIYQIRIINQQLLNYLTKNDIDYKNDDIGKKILSILQQKDQIIKAMEQCVTKYKAQQLKNNKLITQLQDKIAQICPNNNNTGSKFMMASQFKDYFEDFMKNCLTSALSPLLQYPQAYSRFSSIIFSSVYNQINNQINQKLNIVCELLNLSKNIENQSKVRNSLLKLMQDNWQILLMEPQKQDNQKTSFSKYIKKAMDFQNQQICQIIQSQEFKQLDEKLIKICGYMILQQKRWQFILPFNDQNIEKVQKQKLKVQKFAKKDYTCIDGWIKQKQDIIYVVQGLYRQGDDGSVIKHPNLKNYVIPYKNQNQQQFVFIKKIPENKLQKQQRKQISQNLKPKIEVNIQQKPNKVDKSSQYSPKQKKTSKKLQQSNNKQNIYSPNRSMNNTKVKSQINLNSCSEIKQKLKYQSKEKQSYKDKLKDKDNVKDKEQVQRQRHKQKQLQEKIQKYEQKFKDKIETAIRKLNKVQNKALQNIFDQVNNVLSPKLHLNIKQKQSSNHNHTLRVHNNIENIYDSNQTNQSAIIKTSKLNKNNSKNNYNLISDPSFEQIMCLPHRKNDLNDQLPLKRQTSKNKKSNNSRKTSVGKIVGQCIQGKQNVYTKNSSSINKQKEKQKQKEGKQQLSKQSVYKDMIKQKLGAQYKTERQRQKPKQSKNKQKDQDRPLRIMHFKKIRDKYLNV